MPILSILLKFIRLFFPKGKGVTTLHTSDGSKIDYEQHEHRIDDSAGGGLRFVPFIRKGTKQQSYPKNPVNPVG